jgi:signal transduction histidine kinase
MPWLVALVLSGLTSSLLIGFAIVTLSVQEDADIARGDAGLVSVASAAAHLVGTGPAGRLPPGFLVPDLGDDVVAFRGHGLSRIDNDCPQFAIVFDTTAGTRAYRSSRHCTVDLGDPALQDLRAQATRTRDPAYATLTRDGVTVRAAAVPVDDWRYERFGGAAIAWTDQGPDATHQQQITVLTSGLTATMIALFGVTAYVLTAQLLPARLRALEQQETVLAQAAHDLRSPIAALRALAETARHHPEQRTALLDRTANISRQMGDIVDDLLSRARITAGLEDMESEPLRLDQLVVDLVDDIDPATAHITATTAPTVVNGNPALLRRAVRNLLDNAVRYGHLPGEPARVHVTVAAGRVTVADEGPGLNETDIDTMFKEFHSGSGSTGLGLPIARWVAHAHGGTLTVHSADGGGTIFEFVLPSPVRDM